MNKSVQLLESNLLTQVGLEEGLCSKIALQLANPNIDKYPAVKEVLKRAKEILEEHFTRLNLELDRISANEEKLEKERQNHQLGAFPKNSIKAKSLVCDLKVSEILEEDYDEITFSVTRNKALHALALAAGAREVARVALKHSEKMTNLVRKIEKLLPIIVAQELSVAVPVKS